MNNDRTTQTVDRRLALVPPHVLFEWLAAGEPTPLPNPAAVPRIPTPPVAAPEPVAPPPTRPPQSWSVSHGWTMPRRQAALRTPTFAVQQPPPPPARPPLAQPSFAPIPPPLPLPVVRPPIPQEPLQPQPSPEPPSAEPPYAEPTGRPRLTGLEAWPRPLQVLAGIAALAAVAAAAVSLH